MLNNIYNNKNNSRKNLRLLAFIAISAFVSTKAFAQETSIGKPNAKVTIIEYASLTCSHCAEFQKNVFDGIKKKYIDSGKVKYIFRPYPTEPIGLSVGMQIIADCAPNDKRLSIIDAYLNNQQSIFKAAANKEGALPLLLDMAQKYGGLDQGKARQCLADRSNTNRIIATANYAQKRYKITGTPSLIINGKLYTNSANTPYTLKSISEYIDKEYGR